MDCITWCLSTDVDEVRRGPQIELCLGGVARDLVREIDLNIKINGGQITTDAGVVQNLIGAAYILHVLSGRFMPLPEEVNVRAVADFHGFQRLPGEPIDAMLTRFEVVAQRVQARAGAPVQVPHAAWMILLAMKMPTEYWVHLLTPFRGALPSTDQEHRQFLEYVKRFGHLAEAGAHSIQHGVMPGRQTMLTQGGEAYPTWEAHAQSAPSYYAGGGVADGMQLHAQQVPPQPPAESDDHSYEESDSDTSDEESEEYVWFENEPDMSSWDENAVAEYLYQRYKAYKKRWRRHVGKPPRFRRRTRPKGRGRRTYYGEAAYFGKGKSAGKGGTNCRMGKPFRQGRSAAKVQ